MDIEEWIRKLTGGTSPNKSIEAADELGNELVDSVQARKNLNHVCTRIGVFLVEYSA